jgi:hypothetical protein
VNGLSFGTKCLSNLPGSDFEFPTTLVTDDVYACMEQCSTAHPACYGIAYNIPNGFCYLKNSSVVGTSFDTTDKSTHSALVTPVTQLTAGDTSCPFGDQTTQQTSNGMEFEVHCGKDMQGGDYCPGGNNATCPWHATSLSDCMGKCSTAHPLCTGVSFNADMDEGYANCYPKNNLATAGFVSGESWVTHSAVAAISNITTNCADNANITATNNKEFGLQCNQNRAGNDITVYHEVSLQKCAENCATYTGSQCLAVIFDGNMELGWENCYLKSATGIPAYNSTATFALITGVKDVSSSGSSSKKSSSKAWIAGLVVGLIVLLALIVALAIIWRRRNAMAAGMRKSVNGPVEESEYQQAVGPMQYEKGGHGMSIQTGSSGSTSKEVFVAPVELADTQMPHELGIASKRSSMHK